MIELYTISEQKSIVLHDIFRGNFEVDQDGCSSFFW